MSREAVQLPDLSDTEREWIRESLLAIVHGPFVPNDGEVHTLIGLWRREIQSIAEAWTSADDSHKETMLAINGALNTLLYYPHKQGASWSEYLSPSPEELASLYEKWRDLRGFESRARGGNFFRRMT